MDSLSQNTVSDPVGSHAEDDSHPEPLPVPRRLEEVDLRSAESV